MDRLNETNEKDNDLAEFTDRLLDGKTKTSASNPDEELLSLEKTILRLSAAFPPPTVDEVKTKQMLVRLKSRMKREEEAAKPSIWKRLFDFQSNPQMGLIFAVAAVVVLAIVVIPTMQSSTDPSMVGTATTGTNIFTALGLGVILLILYWVSRRK